MSLENMVNHETQNKVTSYSPILRVLALFTTATATSAGYAQDEPSFLRGYEVDWDADVDVWSTSASCTHNWYVNVSDLLFNLILLSLTLPSLFLHIHSQCAAAVGGCPACVSNCKCQQGGCSMPACTTNGKRWNLHLSH